MQNQKISDMLFRGSFDRTAFAARAGEIVTRQPSDLPFVTLDAQVSVAEALTSHRRVIAVLPTGSGKTLSATLPFALNLLDPGQMTYMTPLRTLTSAQANTLRDKIQGDVASSYLGLPWNVCQQTGANPEDPDFEATATVTTFDQALSSALRISYSTSVRRRTVNAGAVLGSYLVADELHLFPRGEALTTLLSLLKHRPEELPFLLMTATLTPEVANRLALELDAHLLAIPLSTNDKNLLGLATRHRYVRWQATPITAEQIVMAAKPGIRVLVVVNTVKRAIELGRAVAPALEGRLRMLHSRFYQMDRKEHEVAITGGFSREQGKMGTSFGADGGVVIATQVVEVGLDISADVLLTELAPASALVQRWGRCARWGGTGEIVVAVPPPAERHAQGEEPVYPYTSQDEKEAVQGARSWLEAHATGPEGVVMDDANEHALLDASHAHSDARWLDRLMEDLTQRTTAIGETIAKGKYTSAGQLIRNIDTRTVLVCDYPDERLKEPYSLQGFSLAPGSLMSLLPESKQNQSDHAVEDDEGEGGFISLELPSEDANWRLKRPALAYDTHEKVSESSADVVTGWIEVKTAAEIRAAPLLLVNPRLVSYDLVFGLSLKVGPEPIPPGLWAPEAADNGRSKRSKGAYVSRSRETFEEHVNTMLALLDKHPVLWPRLGRIAALVDAWCAWPEGTLMRLTRTAIVAHDAGKLSAAWQRAIKNWQNAIGMPVEHWLVHTDDGHGKPAPWNPPPHALSGAAHSASVGEALDKLVAESVRGKVSWAKPSNILFTAIATHHTPSLAQAILSPAERLEASGLAELNRLLNVNHLPDTALPFISANFAGCGVAQSNVDGEVGRRESFALALVTRLLRLSDAWSQDHARLAAAGVGLEPSEPADSDQRSDVEGKDW